MSILNEKKLNQKYFENISQIPRNSGDEKRISDYVTYVAKTMGYRYIRDTHNNVIVYVPATEGYENSPSVMCEAHMDMVCVKKESSNHNFKNDPIELYIDENNNVRAKDTTLGADDGYGVAYMLAMMEDKFPHPALELVFTTEEETGCSGAEALDCSFLKSRRMIGLDVMESTIENISVVSSFTSDLYKLTENNEKIDIDMPGYRIYLHGVEPMRQGLQTNQFQYNAIKIMARLLNKLDEFSAMFLISAINGGTAENMLPTECTADVIMDEDAIDVLYRELNIIKDELDDGYQHLELDVTPTKITSYIETDVVHLLYNLPNNTQLLDNMNKIISTVTLGKITTEDGRITILMSSRVKEEVLKERLNDHIQKLANMCTFEFENSVRYNSWPYKYDSFMRNLTKDLMKEVYGKDMIESVCPGGLECSYFIPKMEGLDVTMFAPIGENCHTTEEYLNLDSFDRVYDFLKLFLERCK